MFFRFISRLVFLCTSTNQHGVHSPFVFDFVTNGLYKKNYNLEKINSYREFQKLSKKEKKVLSKVIHHFKVNEILFDVKKLTNTLDKNYKTLYVNTINKFSNIDLSELNSNTFIVVHNIYNSRESIFLWKKIISTEEISVTIDLYIFGLIFKRTEQAKEHFKIRV